MLVFLIVSSYYCDNVINNYYTKLIFTNKILKKDFFVDIRIVFRTPRVLASFPHLSALHRVSSIFNCRLLRIPLTVIVRISHDQRTMRTGFGKRRKRKLYSQTVNTVWFEQGDSSSLFHVLFFIYHRNPKFTTELY